MRMGFMADKAGPGGQKVLSMISEVLIMLLAASVMIYGGVTIMDLTMTQSTASLGIPMGVVYTIIPISGVLIVFYAVLNLADLITGAAPQKAKDA